MNVKKHRSPFPDHPLFPLPPLREVLSTFDLMARKSLGQNFLLDLNLTGRIARSVADLCCGTTIEIGPGPGGLTRALLDHGSPHVIAIERDQRMIPIQNHLATAYPGRLTLLHEDALRVPVHTLGETPRRVVANLPYNIATPLLLGWLRYSDAFSSITVMLQKEVAARLGALPKTKSYGRLSIVTQWLCAVEPLFDIHPKAFIPPPKVTSTLMRLVPHQPRPVDCSFEALEIVTAAAFGQRRKMLKTSLRPVEPHLPRGMTLHDLCSEAGITPTARAEDLTIAEFCMLASRIVIKNSIT